MKTRRERPKKDQEESPPEANRPAMELDRFPPWVPAAVYALVALVLFREVVLGGGTILGVDTLALGYFARDMYTQSMLNHSTFPLWDPFLFGGLPFIDGMHGDIFYPPSLALLFSDPAQMWGWKMLIHVFLAGCFTYLWLRELALQRAIAFFGGLVYMLGTELVSQVFGPVVRPQLGEWRVGVVVLAPNPSGPC